MHVEQEIVQPSVRVEVPGVDYRQSYADNYVEPLYVGEPYLLGAFIKALPSWIAVQVHAALDARGQNPVLLDMATAQEVFSLVRTILASDQASAVDAVILRQVAAWMDSTMALDPLALAATIPVSSLATALDGVVFGYPQVDTGASTDFVTTGIETALRDPATALDAFALLLSSNFLDVAAAADNGSLHKQNYAAGYVENTYVGELITF
ncbi:hypothetical protein IB257_25210 [Achromobacter sp. ACM03]|nr:hypothetical protein [Achromobacter sp. ACM03]